MKNTRRFAFFTLPLLLIIALISCSGGGDSAGSSSSSGQTGTVALMLTDGPAAEYDHIWISVRRALLLSGDDAPQVVVFDPETPVEYDLLNLQPEDDADGGALLAMQEVPAGIYSKIRLEVESVRGETILPDGGAQITDFRLSSKKIDLNPQGVFEVTANASIAVTIDIDCDKSIHISGNHKNFRPVVFVQIEPIDQFQRCPRILNGTVSALALADDEATVAGFELTVTGAQSPINVLLDGNTTIIDDTGMIADPQALALDDTVYVRGRLQEDGLLASMIVIGDVTHFDGTISTPVIDDQFTLSDDQDHTIALIPDTTLILWRCDDQLTPEAIQPGMHARVIGKVQGDEIIAIAVLLRPRLVKGELTAIEEDEAGYLLTVIPEGDDGTSGNLSIFLPMDTPINIKFDGTLTPEALMALVECQPRIVSIPIDYSAGHPLSAAKVVVLPEPMYATAISVDADQNQLTTDNGLVEVNSGAHVFDLTMTGRPKAELAEIAPGDLLLVYGLALCPDSESEAVFKATVILILPEMPTTASTE